MISAMPKPKKVKNKSIIKIQNLLIFIFFLGISLLYFHNATRDIYSGDIGDFVTAAFVFGVPHPPGYPLFTFLGFIFSHIPFNLPVVTRVGLISILSSIISLIFFFKFCRLVTKNIFMSILATSVLAFSYELWFFTEIPEVFAFHGVFVTSILYFLFRFYEEKKVSFFYISILLLSLSFTNHQTIVLLFPSVLLISLSRFRLILKLKNILLSLSFILLGITPYVYTLIAASHHPVINWDNVSNLKSLIHLVLRQDYSTFGGSILSLKEKLPIFSVYFSSLFDNYSILTIIIIFIGMIYLLRKNLILALSFLITFIVSGPLFILYIGPLLKVSDEVGVIERFFLMSFIILIFFFPYGLLAIRNILNLYLSKKMYSLIILSIFFMIPIMMIFYNFPKTDLSHTHIGNNLARDIFSSVSPGGILFLHNDSVTFNTWYVHYALLERKDIQLINQPNVAGDKSQENVAKAFIKNHPEENLTDITEGFLMEYRKKGEIYSTYPFNFYFKDLIQIPYGLTFNLINTDQIPTLKEYKNILEMENAKLHIPRREMLSPAEQNLITPDITHFYSNAFRHMGTFALRQYTDLNLAISLYRKAALIDNENSLAFANLAYLEYKNGACKEAEPHMKKAIELYSIYRLY